MIPSTNAKTGSRRAMMLAISLAAALPSLQAQISPQTTGWASAVTIETTGGNNIRERSKAFRLGFNVPWNTIQSDSTSGTGLWDAATKQVFPFVTNFLKEYCRGDLYRFPGGTIGNDFFWKGSIGPLPNRQAQWVTFGNQWVTPHFGFDEFMRMVESVGGEAVLTINMTSPTAAQDAADWVEYCNAPNNGSNLGGGLDWAARRANSAYANHPSPYAVKKWELGNELDTNQPPLTVQEYIAKAIPIVNAMRAIDPNIEIVAHGASGVNLGNLETWKDWHRAIFADPVLSPKLDGLVIHTYYEGNGVHVKSSSNVYAVGAANDVYPKPVWITEHSRTPVNLNTDQTTWPTSTSIVGAIATSDKLLATAHNAGVEFAQWHALAGQGPWRPFNGVDPATGKYDNTLVYRPLAYAMGLLNEYLPDKVVLDTKVLSPNISGHTGGYDVRGIVLRDDDNTGFHVAAINRHNAPHPATMKIHGLAAGNLAAISEYVGGADAGELGIHTRFSNLKVSEAGAQGVFNFQLPPGSVSVVRPLGTNHFLNPDLEEDDNADGIPNQWEKRGLGTVESITNGDAFDGSKHVRLTKTTPGGSLSLSQASWNNSALNTTGFVGVHLQDYFLPTVCYRCENLSPAGARLRVQIFTKDPSGVSGLRSSKNSIIVTGTVSEWMTVSADCFRLADHIPPGHTFHYMDMSLQVLSSQGTIEFDSPTLIHLPNQLKNPSLETDSNHDGIPDNHEKRLSATATGTIAVVNGNANTPAAAGEKFARITKTSGGAANAVSLAQSSYLGNPALGQSGYVASRLRDFFFLRTKLRGNDLDAAGGMLGVQFFYKKPDGTAVFYKKVNSAPITGSTPWEERAFAFRPVEYLPPGAILQRIEVVVSTASATGSLDVDDLSLVLLPPKESLP